jgi:hypothetical protein
MMELLELFGTFRQKFHSDGFKGFVYYLKSLNVLEFFWNFSREGGPLTKMKQQHYLGSQVPQVPNVPKFQSSTSSMIFRRKFKNEVEPQRKLF